MNNWYKTLNTAPWSPPSYVFGIVWPILYILMTMSVLIVFLDKKCYPYCSPLTYFFIQLILNLSWTTIFFQLQMPILSFIMIILIMVITGYTAIRFYPYSKIASYLLIPYLLWLCVALSLNGYIILNN
tara:strand:+ start:14263 stop:14646 length:384 start_codon:yes stop_codon:yes gene_type:complete